MQLNQSRPAPRRCPGCLSASGGGECEACELFLCSACGGWVSWDVGAADDDRCDECWSACGANDG